jgi:hypothetical protein
MSNCSRTGADARTVAQFYEIIEIERNGCSRSSTTSCSFPRSRADATKHPPLQPVPLAEVAGGDRPAAGTGG